MRAHQNHGRMTVMFCSLSLMSRTRAFMPALVCMTHMQRHPRCTPLDSLQTRQLFATPLSGISPGMLGVSCNKVSQPHYRLSLMSMSSKSEDVDKQEESVWYADGLSFRCTMCGHCCSGSRGSVQFTEEEAEGMATKVGVSVNQFYNQYTKKLKDGSFQLKEVYKKKHGFDCVFLDRKTMKGKAICSLYEARPQQCRTWPFWPENLGSPEDWEEAGEECPGINKGPLRGLEEIERAMENDGRS